MIDRHSVQSELLVYSKCAAVPGVGENKEILHATAKALIDAAKFKRLERQATWVLWALVISRREALTQDRFTNGNSELINAGWIALKTAFVKAVHIYTYSYIYISISCLTLEYRCVCWQWSYTEIQSQSQRGWSDRAGNWLCAFPQNCNVKLPEDESHLVWLWPYRARRETQTFFW